MALLRGTLLHGAVAQHRQRLQQITAWVRMLGQMTQCVREGGEGRGGAGGGGGEGWGSGGGREVRGGAWLKAEGVSQWAMTLMLILQYRYIATL